MFCNLALAPGAARESCVGMVLNLPPCLGVSLEPAEFIS